MFLQVLGTAHKKGQRNNGLEKKRTCIKFVKYKMSAAVKIDECVRLRGFVDLWFCAPKHFINHCCTYKELLETPCFSRIVPQPIVGEPNWPWF